MDSGYKIRNQHAAHFLTFTIVGWIDIFTRKLYRDLLLENLRYCQREKGLEITAWCLMSNHLHLLAASREADLSGWIRDLKSYTSRQLTAAIANNQFESCKEWILRLFAEHGASNKRNKSFQLWKQDNHPEECYSAEFTFQKINYIHDNLVRDGIVANSWEYLCSSAIDYHTGNKCGLLDITI